MSSKPKSIVEKLIGSPIETAAAAHQSISNPVGLAVFASDALSSTAYATEEILVILAFVGAGVFHLSLPIALAIVVLLFILTISYRQTIHAYPNGGGAYIVSRDNLGDGAAQIAAAALLSDYILTVAVSISSGVAQIASAFPVLVPYKVIMALILLSFMAVMNLRGVKESGKAFAVPTYFFLGTIAVTIMTGLFRWAAGNLPTLPDVEAITHTTLQPLTIFILLRAFSSGCTALTGVEAISNGIPAFKDPKPKNAATTLTWMAGILGATFLGITFLANQIGAHPSETETIISQLGRAVFGRGVGQVWVLSATTLILIMAANTSFADFPRLAALAATDGFLPRQLAYRGSRLVFSWGIVLLAAVAGLLLIFFNADTTSLIPLYAIGVFLSFTLSQTGMVLRWRRIGRLQPGEVQVTNHGTHLEYDRRWQPKSYLSGIGTVMTFVVMVIFAVTKFSQGAWIIILLIPALIWIFYSIRQHYKRVANQLSLSGIETHPHGRNMQTILLVNDVHAGTLRMVNFAISQKTPWEAVHIAVDPEKVPRVQEKWHSKIGIGKLTILESPFRSLSEPLRAYLENIQTENPNIFIQILVGQLAMPSYWEQLLHRNTNLLIDLVMRDMDRVAITSVPYQIDQREQYVNRLHAETDTQDAEDLVENYSD